MWSFQTALWLIVEHMWRLVHILYSTFKPILFFPWKAAECITYFYKFTSLNVFSAVEHIELHYDIIVSDIPRDGNCWLYAFVWFVYRNYGIHIEINSIGSKLSSFLSDMLSIDHRLMYPCAFQIVENVLNLLLCETHYKTDCWISNLK